MTLDEWVRTHEFLRPLARLHAHVDTTVRAVAMPDAPAPDWTSHRLDFQQGVPLLHGEAAVSLLAPTGRLIDDVVARLASEPLEEPVGADMRVLHAELRRDAGAINRAIDWLLAGDALAPPGAGSFQYVGWLVMTAYLRPVLEAFAAWRDDEGWLRRYCPTCASLPSMAHLVGTDPGRRRYLSCGCCGTRWRYGRTECPFCQVKADRLASFDVDGESGLRIDYCESCRGYLKTYAGHGAEAVLLADWTSLHLDLAARDRGLKRLAASLYELDAASTAS